jgi:hypothetical protein
MPRLSADMTIPHGLAVFKTRTDQGESVSRLQGGSVGRA